MNIKVILVDDHQMFREGLRLMIESQSDMELLGEAGDGRTAIQLVEKLAPDVVVMDVAMPDLNGIEATRQLHAGFPNTKAIALSMYLNKRYVIEMLKAGASGYLLKDCAFNELSDAIRTVVTGQIYLNPKVNSIVVQDYLKHLSGDFSEDSMISSTLSDREREVLQLLAEGGNTKQIASALYISAKTVERHRQNIMGKLNIRSIAELTKYAIREGLTTADI